MKINAGTERPKSTSGTEEVSDSTPVQVDININLFASQDDFVDSAMKKKFLENPHIKAIYDSQTGRLKEKYSELRELLQAQHGEEKEQLARRLHRQAVSHQQKVNRKLAVPKHSPEPKITPPPGKRPASAKGGRNSRPASAKIVSKSSTEVRSRPRSVPPHNRTNIFQNIRSPSASRNKPESDKPIERKIDSRLDDSRDQNVKEWLKEKKREKKYLLKGGKEAAAAQKKITQQRLLQRQWKHNDRQLTKAPEIVIQVDGAKLRNVEQYVPRSRRRLCEMGPKECECGFKKSQSLSIQASFQSVPYSPGPKSPQTRPLSASILYGLPSSPAVGSGFPKRALKRRPQSAKAAISTCKTTCDEPATNEEENMSKKEMMAAWMAPQDGEEVLCQNVQQSLQLAPGEAVQDQMFIHPSPPQTPPPGDQRYGSSGQLHTPTPPSSPPTESPKRQLYRNPSTSQAEPQTLGESSVEQVPWLDLNDEQQKICVYDNQQESEEESIQESD